VKQAGGGQGSAPPAAVDDSKVSGAGPASPSSSSEVVPVEVKLEQLQSLGFNRAEAEAALMQADGEVNLAASILFSSK
jgi:Holliday junction resolvasome RuvABC DNA-binding subunit